MTTYRILFLDHKKIGEGLQMLQFGGFDGRIKRVKAAIKDGLFERGDLESSAHNAVDLKARDAGFRELAIGDVIIDPAAEKIWMFDHTGYTAVSKQLRSVVPKELLTQKKEE